MSGKCAFKSQERYVYELQGMSILSGLHLKVCMQNIVQMEILQDCFTY